jgi:aspartyl-tRNA(Asn)/glutamyl-tRNA(Gln) amidotransferase subunit C
MADDVEALRMDVGYVARLAHIELTPEEAAVYGKQLGDVLAYIDKLNELDLAEIEPTSHGIPASNLFREDVLVPGLDREIALSNAPSRTLAEFNVPKIVE